MSELTELQEQIAIITAQRKQVIEAAERMVKAANRYFDETAGPLMRRAAKLKAANTKAEKRAALRRMQPPNLEGTDDWSQEEIQNYIRMQEARR